MPSTDDQHVEDIRDEINHHGDHSGWDFTAEDMRLVVDRLDAANAKLHDVRMLTVALDDAALRNGGSGEPILDAKAQALRTAAQAIRHVLDGDTTEEGTCSHTPRCADSVCSDNPTMQRWVDGDATELCAGCGHTKESHAGDKDCMCGECMWFTTKEGNDD